MAEVRTVLRMTNTGHPSKLPGLNGFLLTAQQFCFSQRILNDTIAGLFFFFFSNFFKHAMTKRQNAQSWLKEEYVTRTLKSALRAVESVEVRGQGIRV